MARKKRSETPAIGHGVRFQDANSQTLSTWQRLWLTHLRITECFAPVVVTRRSDLAEHRFGEEFVKAAALLVNALAQTRRGQLLEQNRSQTRRSFPQFSGLAFIAGSPRLVAQCSIGLGTSCIEIEIYRIEANRVGVVGDGLARFSSQAKR